jgi:O-antigen/teichoic acid export membrane protein
VWIHHAIVTLAAMALLLATCGALWMFGGTPILPALSALIVAGPLLLLREWIRRFSFADLDFATALAIDVCVAVSQLGGLLALAYFDALTLGAIFLVMGAACGFASLGWYLTHQRQTSFESTRYLADWRHNWVFARWALRGYLVHNILPYVMVWVVGVAAGTAAAGLLGACTTLIGVTTLLLTGVDRFLTPRAAQAFVEGGEQSLRRVLRQSSALLLMVLVPFAVFVVATGPWLAEFAYGVGFEDSGPLLATLAFVSVATAVGMVSGIGLWAVDRPRANFLADLCSVSVTISMAILLVPMQGALGAALATLAGCTVAAIVRVFTLRHVLSRNLRPTSHAGEVSR